MKSICYLLFLMLMSNEMISQITTPIIKGNFGIEGDLKANYFDRSIQNGNDDWFNNSPSAYMGKGVIDTTGAAAMIQQYITDPNSRRLPFYRTMSVPAFSIVNHRMWIDAVFIRDYHGNDSTMFASGSNKNGMSPQYWSCPVAQSVPDKNEILDMMVHVRRAGPDITDSLWMFGGLSIENTNGDRYFDFEMYQTDIYYDRGTLQFYGYGPDGGHTSWAFDAGGNIITPGDIIFSAHYGSSTLSSIEARIWINKADLSIIPAAFNWSGTFDGAGSGAQYGYAGIVPKTLGTFYTGIENDRKTWAGDFNLVLGDNQIETEYTSGQFMEFGVNLTKLGLDPVTLLGGNHCGMPFRRVLVKTRTSTSFTAALKDFVGPFDFFLADRAALSANTTKFCGLLGIAEIFVNNPVSTSDYTWYTPDGHIDSYNSPTSINVDVPGTYIITQKLQSGCSDYAKDTILITTNPDCIILQNAINDFSGTIYNDLVQLQWSAPTSAPIAYFEIERSTDGIHFEPVAEVKQHTPSNLIIKYYHTDNPDPYSRKQHYYYRLKIVGNHGQLAYSNIVNIFMGNKDIISIIPNPVRNAMQLNILSADNNEVKLFIYNLSGQKMMELDRKLYKGNNIIEVRDFRNWQYGIYTVKLVMGQNIYIEKLLLTK